MKLTTAMRLDFQVWIGQNGGIVLPPSLANDFVRWRSANGEHVVSHTRHGNLIFTGFAHQCVDRFLRDAPFRMDTVKWHGPNKTLKRRLFDRDGPNCFYCDTAMLTDDTTIEHLLSKSHGGTNNPDNLVLAHGYCNLRASNKTIVEKILLRDKIRDEVAAHRAKVWFEENIGSTKLPKYRLVPEF